MARKTAQRDGDAFGESGRGTPREAGLVGGLKAVRRYLGDRWDELLSEQNANEDLETQERAWPAKRSPLGMRLHGWPYAPARRIFRNRRRS